MIARETTTDGSNVKTEGQKTPLLIDKEEGALLGRMVWYRLLCLSAEVDYQMPWKGDRPKRT